MFTRAAKRERLRRTSRLALPFLAPLLLLRSLRPRYNSVVDTDTEIESNHGHSLFWAVGLVMVRGGTSALFALRFSQLFHSSLL